jgi:hypothetical protein
VRSQSENKSKPAVSQPNERRIIVWFLETAAEALLIGLFLLIASSFHFHGQRIVFGDILFIIGAVSWFFFITGYLLSTAIVGILWRGRRPWIYPTIAAVLFSIHLQIWFFGASGETRIERLPFELAGPCIVFACTFIGGNLLRKWSAGGALLNS